MEKVVAMPTDFRSTELTHMVVGCDDGTLHRIDLRSLKSEQIDAPNLGRVYQLLRYAKYTSNPNHSVLIILAANGAAVIE